MAYRQLECEFEASHSAYVERISAKKEEFRSLTSGKTTEGSKFGGQRREIRSVESDACTS